LPALLKAIAVQRHRRLFIGTSLFGHFQIDDVIHCLEAAIQDCAAQCVEWHAERQVNMTLCLIKAYLRRKSNGVIGQSGPR
jgi:hypothetical protein